jgi:hypothetical protein
MDHGLTPVRRSFRMGSGLTNKIRLPVLRQAVFIGKQDSLFVVLVLALLVGNAAGCLARGLAGGLAFAAAAVLRAGFQGTVGEGTDSLHDDFAPFSG